MLTWIQIVDWYAEQHRPYGHPEPNVHSTSQLKNVCSLKVNLKRMQKRSKPESLTTPRIRILRPGLRPWGILAAYGMLGCEICDNVSEVEDILRRQKTEMIHEIWLIKNVLFRVNSGCYPFSAMSKIWIIRIWAVNGSHKTARMIEIPGDENLCIVLCANSLVRSPKMACFNNFKV
jgi:hypothetical protein